MSFAKHEREIVLSSVYSKYNYHIFNYFFQCNSIILYIGEEDHNSVETVVTFVKKLTVNVCNYKQVSAYTANVCLPVWDGWQCLVYLGFTVPGDTVFIRRILLTI